MLSEAKHPYWIPHGVRDEQEKACGMIYSGSGYFDVS